MKLDYKRIVILFSGSVALMAAFAIAPPFNYWTWNIQDLDSSKFSDYGQFISGLLGTLLTIVSAVLLFKTLVEQRRQFLEAAFQSNFYSLLENHRTILNSICEKVEGISISNETGADFFADLSHRIYVDFVGQSQQVGGSPITPIEITTEAGTKRLVDIYDHYFHIHHSDLGHYFRNLYHFVRFIVESEVDQKIKKRHIKILRAQLSNYEMLLLAYNCLHKYGKKFRPLVEEYELLQNLNFELNLDGRYAKRIVDPDILLAEYPHLGKAFKEQTHP